MTTPSNQSRLTQEQINSVVTLYSNGDYQEAIDQIKALNASYPNVPFLFNLIGACYKELGRSKGALKMFETAVKIKPDYFEAYKNLGITHRDLGQFELAVEKLKSSIAIEPNNVDAHYNLAITYKDINEIDKAIESYKKVIEINPKFAAAYNNLGNIFKESGRKHSAIAYYEKAIEINPKFAEAFNNLGNIFKDLDQFDNAIVSYKKVIELNKNFHDSYYNLGLTYKEQRKLNDAVTSFNNAISLKSDFSEAYNELGVCYTLLGQLLDAISCFEAAIKLKKDYAVAYNNLGKALIIKGKAKAGLDFIQKAIVIDPGFSHAYANLGHAFKRLKERDQALSAYEQAWTIEPEMNYILGDFLNAKMNTSNWNNLSSLLSNIIESLRTDNKKIIDPFCFMGLIDNPELQRKATEIRVLSDHPKSNVLPEIQKYSKHQKIRVGYFSGDFREHPVGYLTAGLYEAHNRDHFEIHAFSFVPDTNDEMNLRIKAGVDHFHDVGSMPHKDIALLARSLEIDIAVDLAGYTALGSINVFAMSAAPIQLSYIGYLGTMGVDYYDYLIADQIMIPKKYQKHYVEKIVYLPSFQVNDSKDLPPDITLTRKDIGLPEEGFVFCCFNNTYKFTPTTFDSWAKILKAVDDSVLIVFTNHELSKTNLAKEIIKRGVDSSRLIFGDSLARPDYMARYRVADLFLDTQPYNAGTTASDALRMGLPMITLKGKSYQARMGASIVNALNLPELITSTPEEYESLAIELATNPEKLHAIKAKLNDNLSTAPLYDTKLFTKNLESAYTQMYDRHHQGEEPEHIYVE